MGIRAFCATAAILVGAGQAGAATTDSYDLWLRYEGTSFWDYTFFDRLNPGEVLLGESYSAEDPLGLDLGDRNFSGLSLGDIIRFVATAIFPDDPQEVTGQYENGGSAPICTLGSISCDNTEWTSLDPVSNDFELFYDDYIEIRGNEAPGSAFTYTYFHHSSWESQDGRWNISAKYTTTRFTVMKMADTPAPVPLPATAALLPIGIGALAVMRRRRRSA